jgi:uncharacterized membrane protein
MTATSTLHQSTSHRIQSIDFLRGIIMIIMTLDHVRDYFHADAFYYSPTDLTQTTPELFFTRWITHFCAPVFMFLAGTSAFLVGQKKTKPELSAFLLKRGIWLIIVDMVIMSLGWSFDIGYHVFIFNVIWVFGVSMMILALLIYLPLNIILVSSLLVVVMHNLLDSIAIPGNTLPGFLWALVHSQAFFSIGSKTILVAYAIIPWAAVMALGYCLGNLYTSRFTAESRKKILLATGAVCILLFLVLRMGNLYGEPSHWTRQPSGIFTFLSFLNLSKYPPSLQYLLMTLGPAFLFLAFSERVRGKVHSAVSVYGRVPLFFYIVHVYVIHVLAMVAAGFLPGYSWSDLVVEQPVWFTEELKGFGFSLGIVYLVWVGVVIGLYPLCKWYNDYKLRHKQKVWLSYL